MKDLNQPKRKKPIAFFLITLMLFYSVSCQYFKYDSFSGDNIISLNEIGKIHKSFFVHSGLYDYSLQDIKVDSTSIAGVLTWQREPVYYYNERSYRMHNVEKNILNEVHIYLNNNDELLSHGNISIPLNDIKEIRIIEKDKGKTAASYVFGTLGVILGVFVIVGVIVALTKSSCPYVYAYDGEAFVFEGETFGGAIGPNLKRDDYLPLLSLKASDEVYRLRISNELKERQYTDLAQLVVIEHPQGQSVLLDRSGNPHLISEVKSPNSALAFDGEDLIPSLSEKDKDVFLFNAPDYSENGIIMQFDKPPGYNMGKLVLHGKNTLWFDYQFGEFLEKFGGYYNEWMDKQGKIPAEERVQRIIDSDFPLSIYLRNDNRWELVDHLFTIGPLASRDFVVPIDISNLKNDQIEIKVETGFMFWELDYAGMDFSENHHLKVDYLKPTLALGSGSIDWTNALMETDNKNMIQEHAGEVTEIIYRAVVPQKDYKQTCFLHTSGYYELVREFKGLPKIAELNKFEEHGYFSEFSRSNYLNILGVDNTLATIEPVN